MSMDTVRQYGPIYSQEQPGRVEYRDGVVRTVEVTENGQRFIVWDYTEDVHR